MFQRLIGALFGAALFCGGLHGGAAQAQCATYPYTLTNGTTADANQVMADFNYISGCAAPQVSPVFTGNVGIGGSSSFPLTIVSDNHQTLNEKLVLYSNSGAYGGIDPASILITNSTATDPLATSSQTWTITAQLTAWPIFYIGYNGTGTLQYPFMIDQGNDIVELWGSNSGGTVTIATTTPQSGYNLTVNGKAWATGNWWSPSDARLKSNVTPIADALSVVKKLHGVRYQWLPEKERPIGKDMKLSDTPQIGFIAQEVAPVVPEAVIVPKKGSSDPYGFRDSALIPILVEAVKAQQAEIEDLRATVAALKSAKKGAQ